MGLIEIFKGIKVLEVHDDYFIGARGYKLYKYTFATKKYERFAIVDDPIYALFSRYRLTCRLLRAEITNLYTLPNKDRLIIAKKGIFRCPSGNKVFTKSFAVPRGSRPMNLCITPSGDIYFGEYFSNLKKRAVHIYHSSDYGQNWEVVYTFNEGNINHIHGIFWDSYAQQIWVVTGDRQNECIIANTTDKFKTLNIILRGDQEYRATNLFFYKDFVIYATDSQYIINEIRRIDRNTHAIETMQLIQGTAIKGGQKGNFAYLSTTVEPSKVNHDDSSHLWISWNGMDWQEVFEAQKDILPAIFQFGSIEFPSYQTKIKNCFMFSGRALKRIGGHSVKIKL